MKFKDIVQPIVDLSERPSVSIVTKLKKNDLVVYEGQEWRVEFPPKKAQKGVWLIGLGNGEDNKYIKIVEDEKPKMTSHEKRTMVRNIKEVSKMFKDDEDRLISVIQDYHYNLNEHNNYDEKDVRECMSEFPIDALKKSGVVL